MNRLGDTANSAESLSSHASAPEPDREKRAMLVATGALCGVGLGAAAIPFVASLQPSARALAAAGPVEFDFSGVNPGEMRTVAWRGKPVWIMRRTPAMVTALRRPNADLLDPASRRSEQPADCVNDTRSARPDLFVCVGICTHLGCSPTLRLDDPALDARLNAPGGYYCPCHGSMFDLAGRVVKNVPAPLNLVIPDYRFSSAASLVIG